MIYFTSDHHFGHKNIIQLCNRPFKNLEEMDEEMIRRWNSVVREEDFVYYLGDFSLSIKPVENYLKRLNGQKTLVAGNHDLCHRCHRKWSIYMDRYVDLGFRSVHEDGAYCGNLQVDSLYITLNHFPYDNGEDTRFKEYWPENYGSWLLHGHVHEKWRVKDKQINVGVDVWDFYPVSLDKILEIIKGEK